MKTAALLLAAALLTAAPPSRTRPPKAAAPPPAARPAEPVRYEKTIMAMGSAYTLVAYDTDRGKLASAVDEALEEADRLDHLLSNYKPDSEWSKVNREAPDGPVRVSDELFHLISYCVDVSRRSEGAFDISVGRLGKVWGFYKGSGRLPHRSEIRVARTAVGYQHLDLDTQAKTIRFGVPNLELDPGGIGKGYAVDKIIAVLRRRKIEAAFVSAGTSSLYGLGAPPNEPKGWQVNIRDPKDENKTVQTVYLKDMSMSTSGTYEKFFVAEGRVWAHIFDPRTGYPAAGMLSVSVISPRTVDSEAWTKPYFIQGRDWAARHKQNGHRVFLCEDKPGNPCAWLQ